MFWFIWAGVAALAVATVLAVKAPAVLAALGTAGVILGVATACGPTEGTVVDKTHFPDLSYWTTDVYTTCTTNGRCTTSMTQRWVSIPECWRFKVRTPEDKIRSKCVSYETYHRLAEGEYWRQAK